MHLLDYMNEKRIIIDEYLEYLLPESKDIPVINEAMRYSLFCGGKRLRPILSLLSTELFDGIELEVLPFCCSIEMIHTYSLIHDDLPSMDDDDFRRGKPSNHKVFGEGFAVLAGDALLNKAFEIIISSIIENPETKYIKAAYEISKASGVSGMIGGQSIDIYFENKSIDPVALDRMHEMKTGTLICTSLNIGAIIAGAQSSDIDIINRYGKLIGKAFQIADDILDVNGFEEKLGKPIGSDKDNNKATFVTLYGVDKSKKLASNLINEAKDLISLYGSKADNLIQLADFILSRDS